MLSGGKPAAVSLSRNGSFRLFHVGTPRPCLSLPSPVSTMIRCDGVSTSSEWIDIFRRPSSLAKCGMSQGSFWISSLVAGGRMNLVLPTVSSSTILVILTLPTFQCIELSFTILLVLRCKDAGFQAPVQWIIPQGPALWEHPERGARHARTDDFSGKSRLSDREGAGIRRQGRDLRSGFRIERRR